MTAAGAGCERRSAEGSHEHVTQDRRFATVWCATLWVPAPRDKRAGAGERDLIWVSWNAGAVRASTSPHLVPLGRSDVSGSGSVESARADGGLNGKGALVIGAAFGAGRASAVRLGLHSAKVAII